MEKVNREFYERDILIYCDVPYKSTNCGKYQGFNHDRFYKWAKEQDNIFISEYQMPDGFKEIANIEKTVLSAANGNSGKATEKIFTNEKTYNKLSEHDKTRISYNLATQMTMFDFMNENKNCYDCTNKIDCDKCFDYSYFNKRKRRKKSQLPRT